MRFLLLIAILVLPGCQSDGEGPIRLGPSDKDQGSNLHKDDKPLYREVTDEFGVGKGWKF